MESPPSLEAAPLSEDSGMIVTSGSFSSDSGLQHIHSELQESDYDEKSLSQYDSQDVYEHICGDNFNTVKKGPLKVAMSMIDPPPQFQDNPKNKKDKMSLNMSRCEISTADNSQQTTTAAAEGEKMEWRTVMPRYAAPRLLHLSPNHSGTRPASRGSLQTASRLSSSHNSLTTAQSEVDDSSFITQAISHDALSVTDMYNVPFDSDIYTVPVDSLRPPRIKRRERLLDYSNIIRVPPRHAPKVAGSAKRHSVPGTSWNTRETLKCTKSAISTKIVTIDNHKVNNNNKVDFNLLDESLDNAESNNNNRKSRRPFLIVKHNKKHKDESEPKTDEKISKKSSPVKSLSSNLKQTICNFFRIKKNSIESTEDESFRCNNHEATPIQQTIAPQQRALPSVPQTPPSEGPTLDEQQEPTGQKNDDYGVLDFRTSIQIVRDYGWYWGPISVEASEKLLSSEPDGSFILRDSSDYHYIFTISFKLNGIVRHVRIEREQDKFCFGGCAMFKAPTIVEFIENAVETSQSGRYLFFLNLRPLQGPIRVQLLHPVSRFKHVQSLQHMCRFMILKMVRRDLIDQLQLPRRMIDYLQTPQYYSESLCDS